MTKPVDCHTAAITTQKIALSGLPSQSNEKLVQPQSCSTFSRPRPGFRIHCHAVPVTMNDSAIGYRKIARNAPSLRIFWSSRIARNRPSPTQIAMNGMPNQPRFAADVHQTSLANNSA